MKNQEIFVQQLLAWYQSEKRALPWRETDDPYLIWMSEVMLQQTQVKTVIPYFLKFKEKYPNIQSLAEANEMELLKDWEGLGYYNRIRNFHHAVKDVHVNYNSKVPSTPEQFFRLKGVGPYIGGAVQSIAFNHGLASVDGNVLRVFARLNEDRRDISKQSVQKDLKKYIESFMPLEAGDFNQALMELGATVCTPRAPKCISCPVQSHCESYKHNTVLNYPFKKSSKKKAEYDFNIYIIINDDKVFVRQNDNTLLKGMYEFPKFDIDTSIETIEEDLNLNLSSSKLLGEVKHTFTHQVWYMNVYLVYTTDAHESFLPLMKLKEIPMSRAMQKVFELFDE